MNQIPKIKNLWGDLPLEDNIRTPYVILKEQASLLTEATNGLLIGTVSRRKYSMKSQDGLECILEIKVPSINNYSIAIVAIWYPITLYPSIITSLVTDDKEKECHTEEEMDQVLGKILSSKGVKRIISGLLTEVRLDTIKKQ